jgi:hypothetical protein
VKILITSATSAAAHRLKSKLNTDEVLLGDYIELPAFMLKTGSMIRLPKPEADTYTHEMLTLSLDNNVTKLYALGDEEYKVLIIAEQLFNEYGIQILNNTNEI